MKIKDVIRATAVFLGLEEIVEYCDSNLEQPVDERVVKNVETLTSLANLVINELGSTYIYMTFSESISPVDGKIYFSDLSKHIIKVTSVLDYRGNKVRFKVTPEYAQVFGSADTITYAYLPERVAFNDQIGYKESQVSARVIAYGLASEFCLTQRRFDEAVMWHKRYMDALSIICLPKSATLKKRSFV